MFSVFRWVVAMCFGACALGAVAAPLPEPVRQAARAAGVPLEAVGIAVRAVEGGRLELPQHRAEVAMQPASIMKLLPTYAALSILGPDYRWQTRLYGERRPRDGVLDGALFVQGSGDPALTTERLWLLLRELQLQGVRRIGGDLVIDRSVFALPPYDPAAFDQEPLRPYNAGPDAFLLNYAALRIDLESDGNGVRALLYTPSQWRVSNRLQVGKGPCGDWRERLRVEVAAGEIVLSGEFAPVCGKRRLYLSPWAANANGDGNAQIGDLWQPLWRELGGSGPQRVVSGSVPSSGELLLEWDSPPLAEVVRDTNKFSNNVMARHLLLAIDPARPATPAGGASRLLQWLRELAVSPAGLVLENGSGLSHAERISAGQMAALLVSAWHSPVMPELLASLPVAGVDGTLRQRFAAGPTQGRAHLKTGSIAGVRSLAGYVLDRQGRTYALACMVNHPRAQAAICDALANWLALRE
jgi:D-alanyl-D-alanine carboxypeptidase/D-alanyl-D-alanine-endopeptidase (penicillin-binding protein 4)